MAIVGSGPGCLDNEPGFVDSHDVVVRVNNYKTGPAQGFRTDVFFSYFGNAVKKSADTLQRDGVFLCMAKCPNAQPFESHWHRQRRKMHGVDFRWIYEKRRGWWFCPTYVPATEDFLRVFNLLGRHVPTTGFAAIQDVLSMGPASVFLTGFDFFASGIHNVNERWIPGDSRDPIRHVPQVEAAWIRANAGRLPLEFDATLQRILKKG